MIKRVVFAIGNLAGGGAERECSVLANQFAENGIAVRICGLNHVDSPVAYELDGRVAYEHLSRYGRGKRSGILFRALALRRIVKKFRPDVVVSFMTCNAIQAIAACVGLGIPAVYRTATMPEWEMRDRFVRWFGRWLLPMADGAVFQNESQRAYFDRLAWAKNGVILQNPLRKNSYWDQKKDYGDKKIISVGRLNKDKNPHMLVEAFARVADGFPGWKVEIFGDGPAKTELKQMIEEKGLWSRVALKGFVKDVPKRESGASIFVMTSNFEGMPNALMEAMCMGCAPVTTDFDGGAARMLIRDGENGRIVKKNDAEGLAGVLARLMGDEAERKRIGQAASKLREKTDSQAIAEQWISFLSDVAEKRGGHAV